MIASKAFHRWPSLLSGAIALLLLSGAIANGRQEDMARCFVTLAIEARDELLSREEYVVVVSNLSGAGFGSSFESLPVVLQNNFNTLAGVGDQINIQGIRPGEGSTAFIERVCVETEAALDEAFLASLEQAVPDAATTGRAEYTGEIAIRNQFIISNLSNLGAGDLPPNGAPIGRLEIAYTNIAAAVVRRIDDLGITLEPRSVTVTAVVDSVCPSNVAAGSTCQEVLAEYDISVFNEDEEATRQEFFDMTNIFIQSGALQNELDQVDPASPFTIKGISTLTAPSASPTIATLAPSSTQNAFTPRPTRPLNQCYVGMITSDDSFDKRLNRTEYVSFVNFLKPGAYAGLQFAELPVPLLRNFDELAIDDAIAIAGLPTPNDEQKPILQKICDDTNEAITADCCLPSPTVYPTGQPSSSIPSAVPSDSPTVSPTVMPTQSPSIAPSMDAPSRSPSISVQPSMTLNETEVVNQFVVSNTIGIRAQELNMPENAQRNQVDNAYDSLVELVVSETITSLRRNLQVRGRSLLVDYAGGSTKYYVDSDCPVGAVFGSVCQEVVASFFLSVSQDENVTEIAARVEDAIDSSIEAGNLESRLVDQGSPVVVEEGAPIVSQPSGVPSLAPSLAPSSLPSIGSSAPSRAPMTVGTPVPAVGNRSASEGLSTPVIIGIAAGGAIVLLVLVGGCILMYRKRSGPRALPDDIENNQYFAPADGLQEGPLKSESASSGSESESSRGSESQPNSNRI